MATRIYLPMEPLFDAGEGSPMIVLHGSLFDFLPWVPLLKHFSKTNRVMIPRLPLYSHALMHIRMDDLIGYLYSYVSTYSIRKFICIGSGYGAHIALNFIEQFSGMVSDLILTRPFDVLSGLVSNTLLNEKIGNRFDTRIRHDQSFDKLSTAWTPGIFQDDEILLKDIFFRRRPFCMPATLILDHHSFTSIPGREVQIAAHSEPLLKAPIDLIPPITGFLARQ